MQTFYAAVGIHHVGKLGAIPPTDPDDISQSTPDFCPIFEFQALKNCWGDPSPLRCAFASVSHPLPAAKFLWAMPPTPKISASEKVDFEWVEKRSHFRRLWTKVHQIWCACRGVIAVCIAVFHRNAFSP